MKKFLIILIILFICGILSADVCVKQMKDSGVLLGVDFYSQFSNAKLVFKDVFWNIFYERIKLLGILVLLCFTPLKEKIGIIIMPLFSFAWGFFLMSCIVELGVAGLVVGLASVIPHGVFYGAVIATILFRQQAKKYHPQNRVATNIVLYLLLLLMFLTGCVLESLMSVHFVPWVIRLSFI